MDCPGRRFTRFDEPASLHRATSPPIYAVTEYNILGLLMHYLPMHAPLNPSRAVWLFIYVGAAVEDLTGAKAGISSKA